jgi:nucleotidyltransferase substrate binding protein (TIGR01987 family)
MPLDLSALQQAITSLEDSVEVATREDFIDSVDDKARKVIRAGVIQNFEFTFELSWKFIQRWLRENRSPEMAEPRTRKDLFRHAARNGLISGAQEWFRYAEARNATSHTYNSNRADDVYETAMDFLPAAQGLLAQLERLND